MDDENIKDEMRDRARERGGAAFGFDSPYCITLIPAWL